jgi:tetratricopeptide (TPR) repeat protein
MAVALSCGGVVRAATGTTAADYYRRALHVSDPAKRIALLSKALAINSAHVPSLKHRAGLYAALGEKQKAAADAGEAARLSPDDPAAQTAAASAALDLEQYENAARHYSRAVGLEPRSFLHRARLVHCLIKLRRGEEAVEQADVLVEHNPDNDAPYSVRVDAYEWAEQYDKAVKDLDLLIKRNPDNASHYLRRCINLRCLGRGQAALADAEKAIRLKGRTSYTFAARGCSYELMGELEKALEDYRRAAELDDDKRYFTIWRCIVLRKLGRREEADKMIKAFLKELDNKDEWIAPVIKYLAGEMTQQQVFRLARHDNAETQREQLCEAYYYVGACHLADRKLDKAEALFTKCLAQQVNNFYEHGFAIRDMRTIRRLRKKKGDEEKSGEKENAG